jgi:Predicted outer membrane protein
MQVKKLKKATKKIASSLLIVGLAAFIGFSSLTPTFALEENELTTIEEEIPAQSEDETLSLETDDTSEVIEEETVIDETTTENSDQQPSIDVPADTPSAPQEEVTEETKDNVTSDTEQSAFGTLQVKKFVENTSLVLVSEFHNLTSVFAVYTDPKDEGSYLSDINLVVDRTGLSNMIELPVGTYWIKEVEVTSGYLPHAEMIEIKIEKDKNTLQKIETTAIPTIPPISTFKGTLGKSYTAGHADDSGMVRPGGTGWHYMGSKSHDNAVFCVQPAVLFGAGEKYNTTTTIPYYMNQDMVRRMEIINYYAMKYKTYDWRKAYAIAQSMMWEIIHTEGTDSSINDSGSGKDYYYMKVDGTRVDKLSEWTEIKNNISKHKTKPSFNTKTYDVELNTAYKLTDSNGVINKYTFDKVDGVTITKSGSNVTFKVTDSSLVNKTVKVPYTFKADSADGDTIFYNYQYDDMSSYYGAGWQKCAEFYVKDAQSGYVNLKISGQGELELQKSSNNPSMTEGNNCYSLAGAEYTVYTEAACTNSVGKLTTDEKGLSNKLSLTVGDYWVKETKAPKGFALDKTVRKVTVTSGEKYTLKVTDLAQNDPISVLLEKRDSSTNQSVPVKNGTLVNAEFTFKFYAGEYADGVDPAKQGIKPTRTWVMKTRDDGKTALIDSLKVSGDEFYKTSQGYTTLPIGTLTIQETKAPVGYHLNNQVFVRKITSSGTLEGVNTYNAPIIPENAVRFHIIKYEKGSSTAVAGVEFTHTFPNGTTEVVKTDSNGKIELTGLAQGKHKIVEKSTINGLVVNPHTFEFTINADGSITNNTSSLDDKLMSFKTDSQGNGVLTVYNDFADFNININKINNKDKKLAGAIFTLYEDEACTKIVEQLTTNEDGILTFKRLDVDKTYYLQETKAPKGYRLPVDSNYQLVTHAIKIKEVSAVKGTFTFEIDGQTYTVKDKTGTIHLEGTPDDYVIDMTVTNQILTQLPATGSTTGLFAVMIIFPMLMIITGIIIKDKDKRKQLKTSNR